MFYQILAYPIHGQIFEKFTKTINLKYLLEHGNINYNYIDIQDYFKYIIKKHKTVTDNPLRIYCHMKIKKGFSPFHHKKYF